MKITISFIAIFFMLIAQAQNGSVNGTVTDLNNKPISGATISLEKIAEDYISDGEGNFKIDVKSGNYKSTISSIGYITKTINILI